MADESRKRDSIEDGPSHDGLDRRGFLKCMAWARHRIGLDTVWGYPDISTVRRNKP